MHKKSFTYHNAGKIFLYVIFGISLVETPVVHFLLTIWLGSTVAWVVTIFTILGIIYMIVDFFALKNRPIMIDDEMLYFRLGNRVKSDIKRSDIKSVRSLTSLDYTQRKKKQIRLFTPAIEVTTLIEFNKPILFSGMFGKKIETQKIAIYLDEPSQFMVALQNSFS